MNYIPIIEKDVSFDDIRANSTIRIEHVQDKSTSSGYDKYKVTCSYHSESESEFVNSLSDLTPAIEASQSKILKRLSSF